jgi:large subunit ribosomal protein L1
VTPDIGKAISELKAGKVEFRVDKAGVLHAPVGKVSFGHDKIMDNLKTLVDTIVRLKPSSAKGTYIKSMAVGTTMGPGVKIDPASVRNIAD